MDQIDKDRLRLTLLQTIDTLTKVGVETLGATIKQGQKHVKSPHMVKATLHIQKAVAEIEQTIRAHY